MRIEPKSELTRMGRSELAWACLEAALDPVRSLVIGVVFSSYLVNHIFADANEGQQAWGIGLAVSAAVSSLIALLIGRIADQSANLRPMIAGVSFVLAMLCASLWFALPQQGAWGWLMAVLAIVVVSDLFQVLINSQLARVVRKQSLRLSAFGYTVSQAGTLLAFGAITVVAWPIISNAFHWGTAFESDRMSGPIAAFFCLVFTLPFVFARSLKEAGRIQNAASVKLKFTGPVAWVMASRLLTSTGMFIILGFFGVLPGALFGWTGAQMANYGLAATVVSGLGGLATFALNQFSEKRAVFLGLLLFSIGATLMLSVSATQVAFGFITPSNPTAPQGLFLLGAMLVAFSIAPIEAGQRAMVLKVVPVEQAGTAFGYYGFVTRLVTAIGPLLVGLSLASTNNLSYSLLISLVLIVAAMLSVLKVDWFFRSDS
jgi:MFS transporter, UMF1 family